MPWGKPKANRAIAWLGGAASHSTSHFIPKLCCYYALLFRFLVPQRAQTTAGHQVRSERYLKRVLMTATGTGQAEHYALLAGGTAGSRYLCVTFCAGYVCGKSNSFSSGALFLGRFISFLLSCHFFSLCLQSLQDFENIFSAADCRQIY